MDILGIITLYLLVSEFIGRIYHGPFISDNDYLSLIQEETKLGSRLNKFTDSIIYIGKLPLISKTYIEIFSKYQIKGHGRIFRWSKMTKIIDAEFKKLKQ